MISQAHLTGSVQVTSASLAKGEHELAEAYWRLGQALATQPSHPDRQHAASVKVCLTLTTSHEHVIAAQQCDLQMLQHKIPG